MDNLPKLTREMLDDIEVLELISEIDAGAIVKVPALFKAMFGEDGYKAVKAHLTKDGKCKASDLVAWFGEQASAKN